MSDDFFDEMDEDIAFDFFWKKANGESAWGKDKPGADELLGFDEEDEDF